MKFGSIYQGLVGVEPPPPLVEGNEAEKASNETIQLQAKIEWLKNPRTQLMLQELEQEVLDAEQLARAVAEDTVNPSPMQVIKQLNKATVIRNIITTYGNA